MTHETHRLDGPHMKEKFAKSVRSGRKTMNERPPLPWEHLVALLLCVLKRRLNFKIIFALRWCRELPGRLCDLLLERETLLFLSGVSETGAAERFLLGYVRAFQALLSPSVHPPTRLLPQPLPPSPPILPPILLPPPPPPPPPPPSAPARWILWK